MPMPGGQYLPAAVPAAHAVHADVEELYVPTGQSVHTLAPAAAAMEPAGQFVHVPALVAEKYVPAGHHGVPDIVTPLTPAVESMAHATVVVVPMAD